MQNHINFYGKNDKVYSIKIRRYIQIDSVYDMSACQRYWIYLQISNIAKIRLQNVAKDENYDLRKQLCQQSLVIRNYCHFNLKLFTSPYPVNIRMG